MSFECIKLRAQVKRVTAEICIYKIKNSPLPGTASTGCPIERHQYATRTDERIISIPHPLVAQISSGSQNTLHYLKREHGKLTHFAFKGAY